MKMNKIQFIIILLLFALPVFAQESNEQELSIVQFGEYSVEYDLSEQVSQYHTAYKKDGQLALSVFDTNENNKADLWLRYDQNLVLDLEISDSDGDGQPDTFVTLDKDENLTDLKAPEFKLEETDSGEQSKEVQNTQPSRTNEPSYFVLDPAPTKNKFSFPSTWVLVLAVAAGGAVVFFKLKDRRKK